ncbi:MAG: outer membrane protein assembly factor BamB family protein [Planctomycetota bacterium]|jgi:outer membrane protein assembly factor BamB
MLRKILLVMFFVGSCISAAGGDSNKDTGEGALLISPDLLKQAELQFGWQINLPLEKKERIGPMFVFDKYLYVLTDRNYLFCIDRVKGDMRFCLQLVKAGLKVHEPQYYDGKLLFTVGTRLLVLDPAAGAVKELKRLKTIGRGAVCGAQRNSEHFFVASMNKRLHAIVADEFWEEFAITADNNKLINSILVDEEFVVFTTSVGNIVMTSAQKAEKYWQRDIPGSISAPIARDDDWLYVGSDNTKLYKLDITNGRNAWGAAFQAGARLTEPVTVGERAVYQYAGENGLYAVDKDNGDMLWQMSDGVGLIAEKAETSYIFARPGVLVLMDNSTGKKLFSVNVADVSRFVTNTSDSAIYLSDNMGRVVSISGK